MDPDGNVFVSLSNDVGPAVVELPKTATGFGAPIIIPTNSHFHYAYAIAVDLAGNVFAVGSFFPGVQLVELPKKEGGYRGANHTGVWRAVYRARIWRSQPGHCRGRVRRPRHLLRKFCGGATEDGGRLRSADIDTHQRFGLSLRSCPRRRRERVDRLRFRAGGIAEDSDRLWATDILPISGPQFPLGVAVDSAGNLFLVTENSNNDSRSVREFQRGSVYFGSAYVCGSGTEPAPCSQTLPLTYSVIDSATLDTPKVLTGGMPNLDFTLASGSSCSGSVSGGTACTVNVTFTPQAAGARNGTVEIVDGRGKVITTTTISGSGLANVTGSPVAQVSTNLLQFNTAVLRQHSEPTADRHQHRWRNVDSRPTINGQSFTIAGSTCAAGLAAGKSCTLQVGVLPGGRRTTQRRLDCTDQWRDEFYRPVAGGRQRRNLRNQRPNFGTIPADTTSVIPTITNVGVPGTVTIGTAISGNSFKVLTTAANTCQVGIASGQSCTLPVEFLASSAGAHNEQLTLTPSGGAAPSVIHLDGVEAAP